MIEGSDACTSPVSAAVLGQSEYSTQFIRKRLIVLRWRPTRQVSRGFGKSPGPCGRGLPATALSSQCLFTGFSMHTCLGGLGLCHGHVAGSADEGRERSLEIGGKSREQGKGERGTENNTPHGSGSRSTAKRRPHICLSSPPNMKRF